MVSEPSTQPAAPGAQNHRREERRGCDLEVEGQWLWRRRGCKPSQDSNGRSLRRLVKSR